MQKPRSPTPGARHRARGSISQYTYDCFASSLLLPPRKIYDTSCAYTLTTGRWTAINSTGQGASWSIFQAVLPKVFCSLQPPALPAAGTAPSHFVGLTV